MSMEKRFWSSRIRSLVPYVPGEQPRGQAFIKLNTNETPYPPSPAVVVRKLSFATDSRKDTSFSGSEETTASVPR